MIQQPSTSHASGSTLPPAPRRSSFVMNSNDGDYDDNNDEDVVGRSLEEHLESNDMKSKPKETKLRSSRASGNSPASSRRRSLPVLDLSRFSASPKRRRSLSGNDRAARTQSPRPRRKFSLPRPRQRASSASSLSPSYRQLTLGSSKRRKRRLSYDAHHGNDEGEQKSDEKFDHTDEICNSVTETETPQKQSNGGQTSVTDDAISTTNPTSCYLQLKFEELPKRPSTTSKEQAGMSQLLSPIIDIVIISTKPSSDQVHESDPPAPSISNPQRSRSCPRRLGVTPRRQRSRSNSRKSCQSRREQKQVYPVEHLPPPPLFDGKEPTSNTFDLTTSTVASDRSLVTESTRGNRSRDSSKRSCSSSRRKRHTDKGNTESDPRHESNRSAKKTPEERKERHRRSDKRSSRNHQDISPKERRGSLTAQSVVSRGDERVEVDDPKPRRREREDESKSRKSATSTRTSTETKMSRQRASRSSKNFPSNNNVNGTINPNDEIIQPIGKEDDNKNVKNVQKIRDNRGDDDDDHHRSKPLRRPSRDDLSISVMTLEDDINGSDHIDQVVYPSASSFPSPTQDDLSLESASFHEDMEATDDKNIRVMGMDYDPIDVVQIGFSSLRDLNSRSSFEDTKTHESTPYHQKVRGGKTMWSPLGKLDLAVFLASPTTRMKPAVTRKGWNSLIDLPENPFED